MTTSRTNRKPPHKTLVSVVLPLYNEAAALEPLRRQVAESLDECGCQYEIIFVNDGSGDESGAILDRMAAQDARIRVLHFSRNFGHQAAVQAGLLHASGDAVVLMDSDLQDDPACIGRFVEKWRQGYDVVFATRFNRKEGLIKRSLFVAFYRILNLISEIPIPNDAGNFGLVDRKVADCIARMNDCDRYYSGLRRWVGFRQIGVPVERQARHDEKPRISLFGLFRLAKTAIFSFSSFPLMMFYGISALSLGVCLTCSGYALYHKLFTGFAVPGWTSITITAAFFGALNALGIGILGEYVIRIFDQVRARPQFIVSRKVNFEERSGRAPGPLLELLAEHWTDEPNSTPAEETHRDADFCRYNDGSTTFDIAF